MDQRNYEDIGRQIAETVDMAVRQVGHTVQAVSDTVQDVIRDSSYTGGRPGAGQDRVDADVGTDKPGPDTSRTAGRANPYSYHPERNGPHYSSQDARSGEQRTHYSSGGNPQDSGSRGSSPRQTEAAGAPASTLPVIQKPVTRNTGLGTMITGVVLTALFGIPTIIMQILGSVLPVSVPGTGVMAAFTVASASLILFGQLKRQRAMRFQIYLRVLEEKSFANIADLAAQAIVKPQTVIRDLTWMVRNHWFLQGHFDEKKVCFIATDEAYRQYQLAQRSYQERILSDKEAAEAKAREEAYFTSHPEEKELKAAIDEGRQYMAKIREANDRIPGEEVSRKLDQLETVTGRIFECIREHPDKLQEIRRFMNYYLPMTMKLVEAYQKFDSQPVQGDNITQSKKDIEKTLDQINKAFEQLLNQLFQDDRLDVASDISVLSAMLKQEGLLGSDFAAGAQEKDGAQSETEPVNK